MVAVPSRGRATRIEGTTAPEAEATRDLYERYANQIYRYCLHQLGSREEAEDAVQSTFLNAFRGIKRGVVPELESAWLFKIAQNVCLSRRRSSWRRGKVESPADFELVEELTPAPSRRADELMGLQDVLEEMPESQRRAILLREWQGLSYREIGEELELSQAAVETLIFRARRALASGLEQPPLQRRRAVRSLDLGSLAAALKSLFVGGTTAAKVAATVAAVSATTVVATPVVQHYVNHGPAKLPPPVQSQTTPAPAATSTPDAPVVAPRAVRRAQAPADPVTRRPVTRRPVVAKARPAAVRTKHVRPAHAAPAHVVANEPAAASDEPAAHGKALGHERSTEATSDAKPERAQGTGNGKAKGQSRRPDVPPGAAAAPSGKVAVPDEPVGDETNAPRGTGNEKQGAGSPPAHGRAKKATVDETVDATVPVDATQTAAEPAGNANGRAKGQNQ